MDNDEIFNRLVNAAGAFLAAVAEKAEREKPGIYAVADELLKSGESYTTVNIKIFEGGIDVRATVNKITDGSEQVEWDHVSGTLRPAGTLQ